MIRDLFHRWAGKGFPQPMLWLMDSLCSLGISPLYFAPLSGGVLQQSADNPLYSALVLNIFQLILQNVAVTASRVLSIPPLGP